MTDWKPFEETRYRARLLLRPKIDHDGEQHAHYLLYALNRSDRMWWWQWVEFARKSSVYQVRSRGR